MFKLDQVEEKILEDKIKINVVNMENGIQDTDAKKVFVIGKDGSVKRNLRIEENEKILEKKD